MAMIKSFMRTSTAASSVFKTTSAIQVQPKPVLSSMVATLAVKTSIATTNLSNAQIQPSLVATSPSFKGNELVSSIITNTSLLTPFKSSLITKILPSFALSLTPQVAVRGTDNLTVSSRKFEPYELLTGISSERPELIMMTNFLPLFLTDSGVPQSKFISTIETAGIFPLMTNAGKFVDVNLQASYLRSATANSIVVGLKEKFDIWSDASIKIKEKFESELTGLLDSTDFLLELVRTTEKLKSRLDVRNAIHTVDPQATLLYHTKNYTKNVNLLQIDGSLLKTAQRYIQGTYTLPSLLSDIGYEQTFSRNFTSTKIWLQLLIELKNMLKYSSPAFLGGNDSSRRNDFNPTTLLKPSRQIFGANTITSNLPSLDALAKISSSDATGTTNTITRAWNVLYHDSHFKTREAHIAALANLISKEFRYSYGLSDSTVIRSLSDQFGYTTSDGGTNIDVFDSIIGRFGSNISDIPSTQTNSLSNLAQRQPSPDVGVLTLESKYIDGGNGTLTPGGTYYVDHIFENPSDKFNTTRVDELGDLFEKTQRQFNVIVNGMGLLGTKISNDHNTGNSLFSSILSSPNSLLDETIRGIVNIGTGKTLTNIANDNLGAIFTSAATNIKVRSALFMLLMSKITSSSTSGDIVYHNKALDDINIKNVINSLRAAHSNTAAGNFILKAPLHQTGKPTVKLLESSIDDSLRSSSPLLNFVKKHMIKVLNAFSINNTAINSISQRTRYSNHLDTSLMMIVFDLIVQCVAQYNNQVIVSRSFGNTTLTKSMITYNISRTTTNYSASINDVITRVEREVALTQKAIYAVINSLQKLSSAFKEHSNYLKGPVSSAKLKKVATVIDDPNAFRMLMSEQQIMMIASRARDMSERLSRLDNVDANNDNQVDATDFAFQVLDDTTTPLPLRNAIYGLMKGDEFSSSRGYNKKILTVGLPLGFSKRLKQRISASSQSVESFENKQSDIVRLSVYKVDISNSDIIYKPKNFLFELSRFASRNDKNYVALPENPTLDDIVQSIPTRDFNTKVDSNYPPVTYWSPNSNSNLPRAMIDESYSFLSFNERSDIIQNHIMSYLLEVYTKLLIGVDLAEHNFSMLDHKRPMSEEMVKFITEQFLARVVEKTAPSPSTPKQTTPNVLFASGNNLRLKLLAPHLKFKSNIPSASPFLRSGAATSRNFEATHAEVVSAFSKSPKVPPRAPSPTPTPTPKLEASLAAISSRLEPLVEEGMRSISNMAHTLSPASFSAEAVRQIIAPKQFDRIFNVIVDPDEFEVDYEKTVSTPHGRQSLLQLISNGEIISLPSDKQDVKRFARSTINFRSHPFGRQFNKSGVDSSNVNNQQFKFRERDKNQGDIAFEKYFVTIETYGKDVI